MTDARARIHAMFPLDEAATAELDLRLDALVVEALVKAGVQHVDCPACGAARPVAGECGNCAFKAWVAAEQAARGMVAPPAEKATAEAAPDAPDTLANWLYRRLDKSATPWEDLDLVDREYWEHEAQAVRRAVARDGFKTDTTGEVTG